jgi:predicted PurR-regulated permease PerM
MINKKYDFYSTMSKVIFFGATFLFLLWFAKKVNAILSPFILSFILAYVFFPVKVKINKSLKMNNILTSILIIIVFYFAVLLILFFIVPFIYHQINELIKILPTIFDFINVKLMPLSPDIIKNSYFDFISKFNIDEAIKTLVKLDFKSIFKKAYSSGVFIVGFVSTIVLTPILAFYFLKDWQKIYLNTLGLIPVKAKNDFIEITSKIRFAISNYIIGQMYAILILSTLYSVGLFLTGLKFGFLIGVLTGIFSLIPYVGFGIFFSTSILIALVYQFSLPHIFLIIGVFLFVQFVESNFIIPKLVGSKVGLHPVWVIFGLLTGGSLFGFIGMLIAIPITAIISVLFSHYVKKYKKSEYYEN